jgi:hypothetical protein
MRRFMSQFKGVDLGTQSPQDAMMKFRIRFAEQLQDLLDGVWWDEKIVPV